MSIIVREKQSRCQDRTECVGEHVLLGVPYVALATQECRSRCTAFSGGVPPLDQFIAHGNERDGEHRKQKQHQPASNRLGTHQGFGDRECIKSDAEVRDAVVVIPLEAEQVGDEAKRNTLKCVVPTNRVQVEQYGHEDISRGREDEPTYIECDQENRNQHDWDVLRIPCRTIVRADGRPSEEGGVAEEEDLRCPILHGSQRRS